MFLIASTLPLNDGTKGFRFNFLGTKGFVRLRKQKSNGFTFQKGDTFSQLHLGRLTLAKERKFSAPKLRHFAG